jgi:hypothetical protein
MTFKTQIFIYSKIVLVVFLFPSISILSGCRSLKDSEEKYIGDWEYCLKLKDWDEPMIAYADTTIFSLKEDGTWSFGDSEGNWGSADREPTWGSWDQEYKNFDLNFLDEEVIISNHAEQFKDLNGAIVIIEGVELLRVSVDYTYAGWEHYVNKYGEYDSYNTSETGTANYLFVRKGTAKEISENIKTHFKDKDRSFWGKRWFLKSGIARPNEWIRQNIKDRYYNDEISGLEYNFEKDTADVDQKILLSGIYLFNEKPIEAMNVLENIGPIELQDSSYVSSLKFIASELHGVNAVDHSELRLWNFNFINDFLSLLQYSGKITDQNLLKIRMVEDSVKQIRNN